MIVHCKNTLGDGTILYVDYEVDNPAPAEPETDENATDTDYQNALRMVGVDV